MHCKHKDHAKVELWIKIAKSFLSSKLSQNAYFKSLLAQDIKKFDTVGVYQKCPSFTTFRNWVKEALLSLEANKSAQELEVIPNMTQEVCAEHSSENVCDLSTSSCEPQNFEHSELMSNNAHITELDGAELCSQAVAFAMAFGSSCGSNIPDEKLDLRELSKDELTSELINHAYSFYRALNFFCSCDIEQLQHRVREDCSLCFRSDALESEAKLFFSHAYRNNGSYVPFIVSQERVYLPLEAVLTYRANEPTGYAPPKMVRFISPDQIASLDALFAAENDFIADIPQ